ncbi:class I SAM-dependent methyltransferase [soil metagenome]
MRSTVFAAMLVATASFAPFTSLAAQGHAAVTTAQTAYATGEQLAAVIAGPQRSAANRARDPARHPAETLRFFGLAPRQTVIEIAPGGGWYTEILAPYLRDGGTFYAAYEPAENPQAVASRQRFAKKLHASPEVYGRTVLGTMPAAGRGFVGIAPKGGADMVLTFSNIHNWIEAGDFDDMLRAFYAVLKPGGVLGVEEHRAPAGTLLTRVIASGYVPEDFVIARARAAGFELAARSEINANPRDTKDHANGVWSLPPTLRGGDVDRKKFEAIGESDRMTLKFVKPLS